MKILAIDIGGTHVKYALVTEAGDIISKGKCKTPTDIDSLVEELIRVKQSFQVSHELTGLAISCPGQVDSQENRIYHGGSVAYLDQQNLAEAVSQGDFSDKQLLTMNDAKAAALAEYWKGSLKNSKMGVVVTLGTAVGGAIVADGQLLNGSHFQAGELSFMPQDEVAKLHKQDTLGNVGDHLSAVRFVETASRLLGLTVGNGELVFESILAGNHILDPLLDQYCRDIAYHILTIDAILDLDKVAIGGGISSQPILIEKINQQALFLHKKIKARQEHLHLPEIVACQFKNYANLIGASYALVKKRSLT